MDAAFNELVAAAAREIAEERSLEATVERAVQMCTETMKDCDMAAISIVEHGSIETIAATSTLLHEADQWQFEHHEGPCYDALHHHETVTVNDVSHDQRWPTYGPRLAREAGIHSIIGYRLFTTAKSLGALNVYATRVGAFDHEDVAEGHALAGVAAVAVTRSLREQQLHDAMTNRTVIGQATGILIERFGLAPEAAFGVLQRVSQTGNIKLYAVAERLVETGRLPRPGHTETPPT
jgi:transcriptional regulator with GAF, ATPase, and Fis domain